MRSDRLALLVLVALAIGVHGNAVWSGFSFDDEHYVTNNVAVRAFDVGRLTLERYWSGAGIPSPYWRPAAMLSFGAQHAVAGAQPWSYHLVSVLLHGGTAALLFLVARRLTASLPAALAAAALFAVHPLGVEAVSSIGHRPDVMACFFGIAALLLHAATPTAVTVSLAAVAFLFACASKETGITIIAPLLAYDVAVRCEGRVSRMPGLLRGPLGVAWACHLVVAGAYLVARHAVVGGFAPTRITFLMNPLASQPFWAQKVLALSVLGRSVRLLLWPARLSADYGFHVLETDATRAAPDALLGLLTLLALVFIAIWAARRHPGVTVGVVLAAAAWLPSSNLLFPIEVMLAERFLYLPLAGICLAVAAAARLVPVRMLAGGAALAVLALGARAAIRTFDWRDNGTLYTAAVAAYPESARAQFAFAQAMRRQGDYVRSLQAYEAAIAIWPEFPWPLCERAALLRRFGRPQEALASARRALELEPDQLYAWMCYAAELREAERSDELVGVLRAAEQRFPGNSSVRASLRQAERRRMFPQK